VETVILKGRKDGFELMLADWADFDQVTTDLEALLVQLNQDTSTEKVEFSLESGNRLFDETQAATITQIFERFPRFTVRQLHSNVGPVAELKQRFLNQAIHLSGGIIRSGQRQAFNGDVLFSGTLHKDAVLEATGSVFVLGEVHGLVIAGADGDASAVIVGDVSQATQIRIADSVDIIADRNVSGTSLSYVNDLHILEHGDAAQLKDLRPRLFRKMEEM